MDVTAGARRWVQRSGALLLTLAISTRVHAAVEPAAESSPSAPAPAPGDPAPKTWDDVIAETQPPAPTTVAPTPVPAPVPVATPEPAPPKPLLARPSDGVLEDTRRASNGLFIAGGVTSLVATLLNGVRVYLVTGPCQTDTQDGCRIGWFLATPFTFAANGASFGLVGAGARERGTYDGWVRPDRHRRRAPVMLSLGIPLIGLGFAASVALRGVWLGDYSSPENGTVFDFARPGHAIAYYGGQQLSAIAVAAGIGMVSYQIAGSKVRRHSGITTPWIGPSIAGVQYLARF
ncbi:MAG: hypothetical protein JNK45_38475 [Myxococcales bacterium]|nr:hypothetical protein [Myxococcales bacterium]